MLSSIKGNPFNWSLRKWQYYYEDYPDKAYSVIAESDGRILGHFGFHSVQFGEFNAMLPNAAIIHPSTRNLTILSKILELVDYVCQKEKVDFIWAPANPGFTAVLNKFFKWIKIGYVQFVDVESLDLRDFEDRRRFHYSEDWYQWKFGGKKDTYIQDFEFNDIVHHQLLKSEGKKKLISAKELGYDKLNCWAPSGYSKEQPEGWAQPISVKALNPNLPESILDINNWFLEMGDSDAFEWMAKPYLRQK